MSINNGFFGSLSIYWRPCFFTPDILTVFLTSVFLSRYLKLNGHPSQCSPWPKCKLLNFSDLTGTGVPNLVKPSNWAKLFYFLFRMRTTTDTISFLLEWGSSWEAYSERESRPAAWRWKAAARGCPPACWGCSCPPRPPLRSSQVLYVFFNLFKIQKYRGFSEVDRYLVYLDSWVSY